MVALYAGVYPPGATPWSRKVENPIRSEKGKNICSQGGLYTQNDPNIKFKESLR